MMVFGRSLRVAAALLAMATALFGAAPTMAQEKAGSGVYLSDDAELNKAIDLARWTLPRLKDIYEARDKAPERLDLMVRAAVPDGEGGQEYRWIDQIAFDEDGSVSGVLKTKGAPKAAQVGEPVTATRAMIVDWAVFTESGRIVGAYTTRVDVSRADDETKALYRGRFVD